MNQGQVYKRPQRFFHSFVRPKHRQDAIARVQSQAQKIQDMGVLFFLAENIIKKKKGFQLMWVNSSETISFYPKLPKWNGLKIWWVKKNWTPDLCDEVIRGLQLQRVQLQDLKNQLRSRPGW